VVYAAALGRNAQRGIDSLQLKRRNRGGHATRQQIGNVFEALSGVSRRLGCGIRHLSDLGDHGMGIEPDDSTLNSFSNAINIEILPSGF